MLSSLMSYFSSKKSTSPASQQQNMNLGKFSQAKANTGISPKSSLTGRNKPHRVSESQQHHLQRDPLLPTDGQAISKQNPLFVDDEDAKTSSDPPQAPSRRQHRQLTPEQQAISDDHYAAQHPDNRSPSDRGYDDDSGVGTGSSTPSHPEKKEANPYGLGSKSDPTYDIANYPDDTPPPIPDRTENAVPTVDMIRRYLEEITGGPPSETAL